MINIKNVNIGKNHKPFIIAEMSGNHNNSLDRALKIVEAVAKSGAHALKLQTYTADSLTLNICKKEFNISDNKSPWSGRSLYELYREASTPWEWHHPIIKRAKDLGLICFSTPFDFNAVDLLEKLKVKLKLLVRSKGAQIEILPLPFVEVPSVKKTQLPTIEGFKPLPLNL